MKIKFYFLMLWLLAIAAACDKDPSPDVPTGSAGYFVVNEGGFGNGNTSISFYDRSSNTMNNDVFAKKNGRALGDQAQSITVYQGKAYVVVQHSAKIEVINADDYSSIKTISDGIESPRYLLPVNSAKAYLSDWGADGVTGSVKVIDLSTMAVTKSIVTGKGPNEMLLKDGKVYVANSGGFDNDNTISVIDTSSDAVTSTITVGDSPNSLRFDNDGNLWVVSAGKFVYNEDFSVDTVNSTKSTISKVVNGTEATRLSINKIAYPGAAHLNTNKGGDNLLFIFNGGVYSISKEAITTPPAPMIGDKYFYGLAVDPITDEIIGCEAPDFSSPGTIYVYNPSGSELRHFEVGIAPNGIGFK
jgi:YVTN family beta-propeller protein